MARRLSTLVCGVGAAVLAGWLGFARGEAPASSPPSPAAVAAPAAGRVDFNRDVRPILSDRCYFCHGPDASHRKAKLRLDTAEGAYNVVDGVAAIVPGKPGESEAIRRILTDDEDEKMPPADSHRTVSPAEADVLRRWVEQGAQYDVHWAFKAPVRPALPQVKREAWARNGIDRFVLAVLEREGLPPSTEAPRETLIRRVTLDLTGLPPAPAEVDAFLADDAPGAYERVVDRLLASPAFGERMAWDWLDAARYADTNGYQGDAERTMWPWRDWVVGAFNANLPYDQFTVWQLAGDLLPDATRDQRLATAFHRNHMINGEGGRIAEENRVEYVFDQAETTGTVWLGLTFNCTRCHDHKFDPLTKRDYFSLFAFFNQTPVTGAGGDPQQAPNLEMLTDVQRLQLTELDADIEGAAAAIDGAERVLFPRDAGKPAAESDAAAKLSDKAKAALKAPPAKRGKQQLQDLEKDLEKAQPEYAKQVKALRALVERREAVSKSAVRVMVMADMTKPRKTFVLDRGQYDKPTDEEVAPAVPAVLPKLPEGAPANRLGLAQWVVSPDNPLTARVTVNRFWQQFFGVGLVKTPDDFGLQGEMPRHLDLLDWLAVEFRDGPAEKTGAPAAGKWDVKALVRLIVTSATYRQSSRATPALLERDPENRLLARAPRHRLPSWVIRDQALAAAGLLVNKAGGPPVKPYQPPGVWEEATFGTKKYVQDRGEALYRRSLYVFWRRIVGPTGFFDSAGRQVCSVKPTRTNTPLHALTTLNDVTYVEAARAMAERVLTAGGRAPAERVDYAYRLVLSRRPTADERAVLLASVDRLTKQFAADPAAAKKLLAAGESKRDEKLDAAEHAAWTGVCSAILNTDEALSRE